MIQKQLALIVAACLCLVTNSHMYASHILESFTVTTRNVEVREFTKSSIQLRSDSNSYTIKLEPNKAGKVIFSLSGIGYSTTVRISHLRFGVRITGYHGDRQVYPIFSCDDVNRDMQIDGNTLRFEQIYGSLPVWFDQQVDSINLQFSNSLELNVNQYLGIQDLRIVPPMDITPNPPVNPCNQNKVMIAIDGSSSIDKEERGIIADRLLEFIRKSGFAADSNTLCITEYGTDIHISVESMDRRELARAVKKYRRDKNNKSHNTSWTNWSVPFDEAIRRRPDVCIFITDGWSNRTHQGPSTFSAQYEALVTMTNTLKANGTRLLFVTSDIDTHHKSGTILSNFLNGDDTCELEESNLTPDTDLREADLITMRGFSKVAVMDFSSILRCPVGNDDQMLDKGLWQMVAMAMY